MGLEKALAGPAQNLSKWPSKYVVKEKTLKHTVEPKLCLHLLGLPRLHAMYLCACAQMLSVLGGMAVGART